MKGHNLLKHVIVYFIEILFFATLIRMLTESSIFDDDLADTLKQYVFAYTLYQLILLAFFKFKDTIVIDSATATKNLIDKLQIYAEFNMMIPEEQFVKIKTLAIENQNTAFIPTHREFLEKILILAGRYNKKEIEKDYFRFILKQESREVEMQIKIHGYHWMNSILLRYLK